MVTKDGVTLRKIESRKTQSKDGVDVVATMYRDAEWNEYRVMFNIGGKVKDSQSYHTTDKEDARSTMVAILTHYESKFVRRPH